jgi:hypothetical protein
VEGNSAPVEGIYDRTISALLNKLSKEMGPNITLIMDCCYSGGIDRGDEGTDYVVREIFNPPQACAETDEEICNSLLSDDASLTDRGGGHAHGFSGKLEGSHVLLAACEANERAFESSQWPGGIFTHHLLEILKTEGVRTLTYTSLLHKLEVLLRRQTARCEGYRVNWCLFSNEEGGSDWSFILTQNRDKIITLEAGDAQGITVGSVLSVHTTNLTNSPSVGNLRVTSVNKFSSSLGSLPDEASFQIPDLFYCKLLKTANSTINVYCKNKEWLASIFPHDFMEQSGVVLVNTAWKCDLELVVSNGMVSFYRHHKLVTPHLEKYICHEVSANAVDSIQKIVCATRTFYYHLTRSMVDESIQAQIKLQTLVECDTSHKANPWEEAALIPFGENLISKERATIVVDEEARYGMTITNQSNHYLYPFVFYFEPTDLTIKAWYPPLFDVAGGGLKASDAHSDSAIEETGLLRPGSSLAIGYGQANVSPWGFWLEEPDQRDLGFFRVFLSTRPMPSFFCMQQDSPFTIPDTKKTRSTTEKPRGTSDMEERKGGPSLLVSQRGVRYTPKDECAASTVTIIQTRKKVRPKAPLNFLTKPRN